MRRAWRRVLAAEEKRLGSTLSLFGERRGANEAATPIIYVGGWRW